MDIILLKSFQFSLPLLPLDTNCACVCVCVLKENLSLVDVSLLIYISIFFYSKGMHCYLPILKNRLFQKNRHWYVSKVLLSFFKTNYWFSKIKCMLTIIHTLNCVLIDKDLYTVWGCNETCQLVMPRYKKRSLSGSKC